MSTVVSANVTEDRAQAGGSRNLRYRIVLRDSRGDDHVQELEKLHAAPGFDAQADVAATASALLADRAAREDRVAAALIESGQEDGTTLVQTPRWSTSKRIAKRVMRHAFREMNPRAILRLEGLINYLRANFNRAELAAFLDMTTAQVDDLNDKLDAILAAPTLPKSVKDLLAEADAKSRDLED